MIRAHRPVFFQLWAVAKAGENFFVAHTTCMLFGNFKIKPERMDAFKVFSKLIEMRRQQQIPSVHFAVIANALPSRALPGNGVKESFPHLPWAS